MGKSKESKSGGMATGLLWAADLLRRGRESGEITGPPERLDEIEAEIDAQIKAATDASEEPVFTGPLTISTPEQRRGPVAPASLSFDDYCSVEAVNWSTLKAMGESPLRYQYACTTPREDRDVFRLGRATHTAVLEPDRFLSDYVVWPGDRRVGKKWEAFVAMHAPGRFGGKPVGTDKTILTELQYAEALAIRDAVRGNPIAAEHLAKGKSEQALVWDDALTGVRCKARVDWLRPTTMIDLKTSRTIDDRRFGKIAYALGYHGQAALYCDGVEAVTGKRPAVVLIVVESLPPHDVAVYRIDEDVLYVGQETYREHLERVKICRKNGKWPGRYAEEQPLVLPAYAYPDEDEITEDLGLVFEEDK